MSEEKFNGYDFDNPKARKKMKYIVIRSGDLDINNAYAFKCKRDLNNFIKSMGLHSWRDVYAVFEIKDITHSVIGRNSE